MTDEPTPEITHARIDCPALSKAEADADRSANCSKKSETW
jgi:hypothetical protein